MKLLSNAYCYGVEMKKVRLMIMCTFMLSAGMQCIPLLNAAAHSSIQSAMTLEAVAQQIITALEQEPWFWPGAMAPGELNAAIDFALRDYSDCEAKAVWISQNFKALVAIIEARIHANYQEAVSLAGPSEALYWGVDPFLAEASFAQALRGISPIPQVQDDEELSYEALRAATVVQPGPQQASVQAYIHKKIQYLKALVDHDPGVRYRDWLASRREHRQKQSRLRSEWLGDAASLIKAQRVAKKLYAFGFGSCDDAVLKGHVEAYISMLPGDFPITFSRAVLLAMRELQEKDLR
jgi:hypothetical protein